MSITKDTPVPTSYKNLHEIKTLFGIHDRLMFVWAIHIIVCAFVLIWMRSIGIHLLILYMLVIVIVGLCVGFVARDVKTLDRNYLHLKLIFRIIRKKNNTIKFTMPLDDLKRVYKLETVEETGRITYPDGTSSVLIMYVPPRTATHERDDHSTRVKNIINSLYGGFSFQFISNSVVDYANPLLEITSEALKQSDTPIETTTHLYSLYLEAKDKREDIDVEFALVVYLPAGESADAVEQLRSAFIPSVLKSMERAGIQSRELIDRNEVIFNLRKQIC